MSVAATEAAPAVARAAKARRLRALPDPPERPAPRGARFREIAPRVQRAAPTTRIHRANYQPVILAEFVAAVLLVAATPVATKKEQTGISPYAGKDMIKLGSITVLYLILALISTGGQGPGRLAAWFGGLILLTVGLSEAANLAKDLDLFGIGGAPAGDTAPTGSGRKK